MTAETKTHSWIDIVENVEKLIFYASLLFVPISIIPLPWDLTDFSMGLTLLFFSIIIVGIELIKLVWRGRILIPKGILDVGLFAVLATIILSTIFSQSVQTSLFGFDFRLGSGLIVYLSLIIYFLSVRSFLFNINEITNGLVFLIIGTFITALISIFSFYGMNVLSFIPGFKNLFTTGLPLYSSSRVSVVVWGVSLAISIFFASTSFSNRKFPLAFFAILSSVTHLLAISLFTLASGWEIFLLITILVLSLSLWILIKQKDVKNKGMKVVLIVLASLVATLFLITRVTEVKNALALKSGNLITQLTISNDTSLKVATQSLSQSVLSSIFGIGHDSFSIAYNQYRPLNDQTLLINATNFTNANNQFFNVMTTRGLIGMFGFIFLGFLIIREALKAYKNNAGKKEMDLVFMLLNMLMLFIYATSFFVYMPFIINFLLILIISLWISVKNIINKETLEVYVINWGVFTHNVANQATKNMALVVSGIFLSLCIFAMIFVFRLAGSSIYTLRSEVISAVARDQQTQGTLNDIDKEKALVDSANAYAKAISLNPQNDVLHRRASLVVSQYLDILADKYSKETDNKDKESLFNQIATYVEISVEEAKKSTELGPKVYANWGARGSVYSKLVGLGLSSYTKSALSSLQSAAELNPLNYEVYYNAAQLYILNNESDTALRTLNQLFSINPKHIPSLILAGEISLKDKDLKQAERYFSDAKTVMDDLKNTTNDVYDYVVKKLNELKSGTTNSTSTNESATE